MADNYNIGQGLYQAIGGLHDLAATGLVSAQAQQAQVALERQRAALDVYKGMPQYGTPQTQPTPQQPYGVAPTSAFGPLPGLGTPQPANQFGMSGTGVPSLPSLGQPQQLGAPGGQAEPIDQVQPPSLVQAGQPKQLSVTDRLDQYSKALLEHNLPEEASAVAENSAKIKHEQNAAQYEAAHTKHEELLSAKEHIGILGRYAQSSLNSTNGKESFATVENFRQMVARDNPAMFRDPEFQQALNNYQPGQLKWWADNAVSVEKGVDQQIAQLVAEANIKEKTQAIETSKVNARRYGAMADKYEMDVKGLKKSDGLTDKALEAQKRADDLRAQGKDEEANAAQAEAALNMQLANEARGKGGAGKGGVSAQQMSFYNITSSEIGNSFYRLNDIYEKAAKQGGKIQGASPLLLDTEHAKGIFDATKQFLTRSALTDNYKGSDADWAGLAFDVVSARTGGRSQGVASGKLQEFIKNQIPSAADGEEVKKHKLKMIENMLEEVNTNLPASVKRDRSKYYSPEAKKVADLVYPPKTTKSAEQAKSPEILDAPPDASSFSEGDLLRDSNTHQVTHVLKMVDGKKVWGNP